VSEAQANEKQRVPFGRPNRNDDGEPQRLAEALAASPMETAYTRCEPDEQHAYPRIMAVHRAPSLAWQVIEWQLQDSWSGMNLRRTTHDVQEAEAYLADTLNIPRAAVWWPAVGRLSIHYYADIYSSPLPVA